jgi:hypothetical protein
MANVTDQRIEHPPLPAIGRPGTLAAYSGTTVYWRAQAERQLVVLVLDTADIIEHNRAEAFRGVMRTAGMLGTCVAGLWDTVNNRDRVGRLSTSAIDIFRSPKAVHVDR